MSCNKSDRKDLQTMENNILRTCYNVRLVDRLSLVDMHLEASLVSLEQRTKIQLLGLMYTCIYRNERVFARNTRQGNRFNFRVENYQGSKYKSSPYFKGTVLWDNLPFNVITIPTLDDSKVRIRRIFTPFDLPLMRYFHDLSCYYNIGLVKYCHSLFSYYFLLLY